METQNKPNRLHPLVAAAAVGVLLASLVGVAAMTGILPNSNSAGQSKDNIAALNADADKQAAEDKAAKQREADRVAAEEKIAKEREADRIAANKAARERDNERVVQAPVCNSCGQVESVRTVQTAAKPSGVGVVGGAIVGGLLGNQIGGGTGRSVATVAGAVGGGYAGNEIEKRTRTATTYQVRVRMENGTVRNFPFNNAPQWREGDRVRVVDGYLRAA
jgi:outer membrane lipoprotein SlyB